MSNVLQAGLLQNRLAITVGSAEISADVERDFDGLLRAVLHQMMLIGNATGAALAVYDSSGRGLVRRVKDGEFAGVVCPDAKAQDPQMCPALVSGNGMALYGSRNRWSLHCRQVPAKGGLVYCLPLVAEGDKIGTVQLGYAGRVPSPPTRYVAALLNAAEQAAPVVRQAWKNLQYQKRALRLRSTWRQETSRDLAHAERSIERPPQATDISDVAPAPPFLEVRSVGGFELYRQGKLVTPEVFQRRGAITIFQILLTHDGRPVTRDALTEILWPEADPQSAVKRLHVLVHALRRVVEPAPQDRRWTFICNDGDRYYFNAEAPYRLDVKEFRECISLGERLERRGDVAAAIDAYEVAADQYRGDFLEDEPYAEWCWEEREALRETHLDALRRLAGLYTNQNAPELSAESYRRALKADPLREENHQGLMRTLWAAGRRSEALRQYQMCKELLRRELEVDPLPETTELYHLIRDNGER
jgi:DNA-binding SARP family transcriptional activator